MKRRKRYDEIVKSDAPGWFKNAFSFQVKVESASNVKQQCEANTTQIVELKH